MKKLLFLLLYLLSFMAIAQDVLWEKSFGGKHVEILYDALPTPDYGHLICGSSISGKGGNKSDNNKGNYDYVLWKMNEKGELEWQKSYGGSGTDLLQSVQLTNDGGFILAGNSDSNISGDKREACKGNTDFWIIKLDGKGNEVWQKTMGGNDQEKLQIILQTKDGGYIVGGSSSSNSTAKDEKNNTDKFGKSENARGGLDYWLVKLNPEGNIEWQKTIGGQYTDELKSIVIDKDGSYVIGGYSNSPQSGEKKQNNYGLGDYWIVKTNTEGDIVWQQTIGGDKDDNLSTIIPVKSGGYVVGGNSNSGISNAKNKGNTNGTDMWVMRLDDNGAIQWQEVYNFGVIDVLSSIIQNEDGTFFIGGYAQSEINQRQEIAKGQYAKTDKQGINDYIALKINDKGEEIWSKIIGSKGEDILKKIFETRDGGYLFAGTSNGSNSRDKNTNIGGSDFWIVKVKDNTKPEKSKIDIEAFPNPTTSYTNVVVNFDYTEGSAVLYDLNGKLLKEEKISGSHTIPINLENLPKSLYIITIKTNTQEKSVKVIKN